MTIDPVEKSVHVPITPQAAFELFTRRMGEWWPLDTHSVSARTGAASLALEMSPEPGGEIIETAHDGTRHVWGTVLEWSPGEAFACTWHPGRSDGRETRVRVVFETDGAGTKVTLTHSGWDVLGQEGWTTRDGYDRGWDGVMTRFKVAA